MKTLTRDHSYYLFDSNQPCALWVEPGERFCVETYDARRGRLQEHSQLASSAPAWNTDQPQTNPCTGPIGITGLRAGDTVRISIHKIVPERRGFLVQKTDMGICKQLVDQSYAVFAEIADDRISLECGLSLPLRPHIGTLGITPQRPVATGFAGPHGGNMDCRYLEEGTTLYLPVQVDGGLLGVGDVHASMGSGELMGTGVETCATVELSAQAAPEIQLQGPVVCTQSEVMTVGVAPQLQEALEIASAHMVDLLERYGQYSRCSALSLLTSVCDAGICQGFDAAIFSVASVSISRQYLSLFTPIERGDSI